MSLLLTFMELDKLYESTKNDVVRLFNDYFYEGGLSEVFDVVDYDETEEVSEEKPETNE